MAACKCHASGKVCFVHATGLGSSSQYGYDIFLLKDRMENLQINFTSQITCYLRLLSDDGALKSSHISSAINGDKCFMWNVWANTISKFQALPYG